MVRAGSRGVLRMRVMPALSVLSGVAVLRLRLGLRMMARLMRLPVQHGFLPPRDRVRCVVEDLQPRQRVVERRPVNQAADQPGRQLRLVEPWRDLHELPQPLDVFPRHRQHAEVHTLAARIAMRL